MVIAVVRPFHLHGIPEYQQVSAIASVPVNDTGTRSCFSRIAGTGNTTFVRTSRDNRSSAHVLLSDAPRTHSHTRGYRIVREVRQRSRTFRIAVAGTFSLHSTARLANGTSDYLFGVDTRGVHHVLAVQMVRGGEEQTSRWFPEISVVVCIPWLIAFAKGVVTAEFTEDFSVNSAHSAVTNAVREDFFNETA